MKNFLASILAFFKNLFGKKKNEPSNPAPVAPPTTVAPSPAPAPIVVTPPSLKEPAPPSSPEPVASPAAPTLPTGVLEIDSRGACKLEAIVKEKANNPNWVKVPDWFFIELDGVPVTFEARSNLTQAKTLLFAGNVNGLDSSAVNSAYRMSQNSLGFGYKISDSYDDALSFIGDNVDVKGNVLYRGPRPADIPQFVANCNAAYAAAIKRGDDPIRAVGNLPILDHSKTAPVAH